jgi:retron-type reverse transcriptase
MDVATLIARLMPLLDDPVGNGDAILALLGRGRRLAEYEVARFVVSKRTEPLVRELYASPDPKIRRQAVGWVELTFARSPAARFLRDASKDRSKAVRSAAFRATRALHLDDVALPDTTLVGRRGVPATKARMGINPFTKQPMIYAARPAEPARHRGFNPTGWRFGLLPVWKPRPKATPSFAILRMGSDVDALLGVSPEELTRLLRPGDGAGAPYVAFEIPKSSGGTRVLHAPRPALKKLQRRLLDELLAPLEVHPAAHGFVRGRSTITNAAPHVGAHVVLKMDVVDFFPTIHFGRLVGLFEHYGAGRAAARRLAAVVTYRPKLPDGRVAWPSVLPQGAPTSPALSNLVCRRLDARLAALAEKCGAVYTRYADDLTFSFREEPERGLGHFAWWVSQILGQEGFLENVAKRRILRAGGRQRVTGLVTNTSLSVPREARRRFRAVLHDCERFGVTKETTHHDEPRAYLLGFASYVAMVQPELGEKLRAEVKRILARGD